MSLLRPLVLALALGLSALAFAPLQAHTATPQRRLPGGGNANPTPPTYSSWERASDEVATARDKYKVAKQKAYDAKKKYDDLRMSGGGSPDKRGQIDELERAKDDAARTANSFKSAFQLAVRGASNFVDAETKAAATDAAKATAQQHQATIRGWKSEAGL